MEPARYAHREPGEGCLTTAVRFPVRVVVLILVVPVRLLWDALATAARAVDRTVLRPLGRGLALLWRTLVLRPVAWTWRTLVVLPLAWVWRTLVVAPLALVWRHVLAPLGRGLALVVRGLGAGLWWLGHRLVVVPARWLYAWVLAPVGRAVGWVLTGVVTVLAALVRWIVLIPAVALWRYVLGPVLGALATVLTVVVREVADALGHCWRVAGAISRAVGRFLGAVLRRLVAEPLRWAYRHVLTPLGHAVRDGVWRPVRRALRGVRETVRQTRGEIRKALFGTPAPERRSAAVPPHREPGGRGTRTLGSSTTALTKD
ncbi:hypothetical protein [Streptomyces sp. MOE7]|uniref:hypothetical protein n=1 Tax=Streptomyces sp. MOE7 TaxID=1961713 RepID=UPI0009FF3A5B|nr:hypothetical protein [Streptomyces sp. MOE7]ARH91210.1 hypothetical protein STRMOE7_13800 [Streptomyces sp. MOE7]